VADAPRLTQEALQNAPAGTTPTIRLRNPGSVSLEAMQAVTTAAQGRTIRINADNLTDAGAVDVRIAVNPAVATQSVNLGASTTSQTARSVASLFERHFTGAMMVVSTEQQASFGMEVRIVTRLDSRLNADALRFYRFDRAENVYHNFTPQSVWVDSAGFLHFTTGNAGNIIITNTRLSTR